MEDARNDFIELLKQKQISEDFITQLLKNGLTEETIRFLFKIYTANVLKF